MKSKEDKDLGVAIQDTLTPVRKCEIFVSTYRMFMNIRVAFRYMTNSMMKNSLSAWHDPDWNMQQ